MKKAIKTVNTHHLNNETHVEFNENVLDCIDRFGSSIMAIGNRGNKERLINLLEF